MAERRSHHRTQSGYPPAEDPASDPLSCGYEDPVSWDPAYEAYLAERRRRQRAKRRRRERERRRKRNQRIALLVLALIGLFAAGMTARGLRNPSAEQSPEETAATASTAAAAAAAEASAAPSETSEAEQADSASFGDSSDYAALLADGYTFSQTPDTVLLSSVSSTIGTVNADGSFRSDAVTMDEAKQSSIASSVAAGFSGEGNDYVASPYFILVDADTNQIIAGRDPTVQMFPASMTKVMTILVAAEHLSSEASLQDAVTISQEVCDESYLTGSSYVGFAPGDVTTVGDLFYGAILPSGADAAIALADYIAGSEDAFAALMNEKAAELGIGDTTHFVNCVGTFDNNHYTTAQDMAVIMKAAVENDFCRQVLSAHTYTIPGTAGTPAGFDLSNWFLRKIEDRDTHGTVLCGKTGYVKQSGNCAVSFEEGDDGHHYLLVTAKVWDGWRCIYDQAAIYQKYVGAGS